MIEYYNNEHVIILLVELKTVRILDYNKYSIFYNVDTVIVIELFIRTINHSIQILMIICTRPERPIN
jgi:hypothetical protein